MKKLEKEILGITLFISHCFLFSVISGISKKLQAEGVNVGVILFCQTILGALLLAPFVWKKISIRKNFAQGMKWHALRSIFWAGPSLIFFYAINFITLPKAMSLAFAVPLFTTILAIIFLKEKFNWKITTALLAGFAGMLIIIQPGLSGYQPVAWLVVLAAFLWSISDIMLKIVGRLGDVVTSNFYFSLISAFIFFPMALPYFGHLTNEQISLIILTAFLFLGNMYSISRAYQLVDLTVLMPFKFTMLIFSAMIGYIMFAAPITHATFAGGLLIIAATTAITFFQKKK